MSLNANKLAERLQAGESDTVEFKTSFDKETSETLTAFANSRGGTVFVGVSDDGTVQGVRLNKETIQNWINQIKMNTANTIVPDAEPFDIEGKTVVALSVTEYPIKPIACKGRYYRRIKNANHQLTISERNHHQGW